MTSWQSGWLDIPTESEPDENGKTKALTMDGLKEAIADGINLEQTLLIFPEAKRLTTGVRYCLEDLIDIGLIIVAIAVTNPAKDIFLNLIEIEIANPTEVKIREIMRNEAERYYQDLRINAIGRVWFRAAGHQSTIYSVVA